MSRQMVLIGKVGSRARKWRAGADRSQLPFDVISPNQIFEFEPVFSDFDLMDQSLDDFTASDFIFGDLGQADQERTVA
ncbi:MAG: hypothetical protein AB1540_15375 [Bdellovibrionota bacterium]